MKKSGRLFILCFIIILFTVYGEETPLKVKSSIKPLRLLRAQEGKVVLELSLENGITISTLPTFTIEVNPCEALIFPKNFFTASDLGIETIEENGHEYLSLKEPIFCWPG